MSTLRVLHRPAQADRRAPALAVLLPGALQALEEFDDNGFPEAVQRRKLALDLAAVDPGLRFIGDAAAEGTLDRIESEVLQLAATQYSRIWLVGVSIGGFMALALAERWPSRQGPGSQALAGLCLLAPYPGNRLLGSEIDAAGGARAWGRQESSVAAAAAEFADERRVWRWLATGADNLDQGMPLVWMGYGADDRFASGQARMAQVLPEGRTRILAGSHDWPAWRLLWENFLDDHAQAFTVSGAGRFADPVSPTSSVSPTRLE